METKIIYLLIGSSKDQVEFRSDDDKEDVRELFRAAAVARPSDILKLYNSKGNLMMISERTPPNSPDTRYILQVVGSHGWKRISDHGRIANIHKTVDFMNEKLGKLEKALPTDGHFVLPVIEQLETKLETLVHKLEGMEHLSWLGLHKNMRKLDSSSNIFQGSLYTPRGGGSIDNQRVHDKFVALTKVQLSTEVREKLKKTAFDNWQWDYSEMLMLLRQMFIDLRVISTFSIQMPTLCNFLYAVFTKYNKVAFHNFEHCFMVTQMMYGLIWLLDLKSKLSQLEILTLIVSCICHDLEHPGFNNAYQSECGWLLWGETVGVGRSTYDTVCPSVSFKNAYQINARTELALLYNDISPLENHHCAVAFKILERVDCNILQNLSENDFRQIREGIIQCILATDLSKHNEHVSAFREISPKLDFKKKEHRQKLMVILMKTADISNECRPKEVAQPWLDCLLEEFFTQGDLEKLEGLPVCPHMDRDTLVKASSQVTFIQVILLPLFQALAEPFPQIEPVILQPARMAQQYYLDMQKATGEEQKKKKKHSVIFVKEDPNRKISVDKEEHNKKTGTSKEEQKKKKN